MGGRVPGPIGKSQGKTFFDPVPEDDLELVEEGFRMRRAAAKSCRELLAAARAALAQESAAGDVRAMKTRSIGVCSAYRDCDYDKGEWFKTFKKRYDLMIDAGKYAGREHGGDAESFMLNDMLPLKAPPGFSNHSNGTAVDFKTRYDGTLHAADSLQLERWPQTSLYRWLDANAETETFCFRRLASEPWHWDHP